MCYLVDSFTFLPYFEVVFDIRTDLCASRLGKLSGIGSKHSSHHLDLQGYPLLTCLHYLLSFNTRLNALVCKRIAIPAARRTRHVLDHCQSMNFRDLSKVSRSVMFRWSWGFIASCTEWSHYDFRVLWLTRIEKVHSAGNIGRTIFGFSRRGHIKFAFASLMLAKGFRSFLEWSACSQYKSSVKVVTLVRASSACCSVEAALFESIA